MANSIAVTPGTANREPIAAFPDQIGPFRIIELLGEGGMGVVLLGETELPKRQAAIKLMRDSHFSADAFARFRLEMEVLARLEHPGIARLYEVGSILFQGVEQPWYAMEFVSGLPLDAYVKQQKLSLDAILQLTAKVAYALQFAHQKGVIHRDVKPANILVDHSGQPKLLDFGIARLSDGEAKFAPGAATRFGQILGTLAYMSPEQLASSATADVRSDVYALGIVLYELLTGELPIELSTTSLLEAIKTLSDGKRKTLRSLRPEYRGDIELIVDTASHHDLQQRYSSAANFAQDLEHFLSHRPLQARRASWGYVLKKFVQRNRALSAISVLAICSLIGATVWALSAARAESAARLVAERRASETRAAIGFIDRLFYSIDPAQAQGKQPTVLEVIEAVLKPEYQAPKDPAVSATVDITLAKVMLRLGRAADAKTLAKRAHASALQAVAIEPALKARAAMWAVLSDWAETTKLAGEDWQNKLLSATETERHYARFIDSPALRDPALSPDDRTIAELGRAEILEMAVKIQPALAQLDATLTRLEHLGNSEDLAIAQRQYLALAAKWRIVSPKSGAILQSQLHEALKLGENTPLVAQLQLSIGIEAYGRYQFAEGFKAIEIARVIEEKIYPKNHPDFIYARTGSVHGLISLERFSEAVVLAQATLDAESRIPFMGYARGWLGYAQFRAGDLINAEANLRQVVDHHPAQDYWTHLPAQHRLAMLLVQKGELIEAERLMLNVAKEAPERFGASLRLSELAIDRSSLWLAKRDYARVLRELPIEMEKFRATFGAVPETEQLPPMRSAASKIAHANQGLRGDS